MRRIILLATLAVLTACPEPLPDEARQGAEAAAVDPSAAKPTELPGAPPAGPVAATGAIPKDGALSGGAAATGPSIAGTFGDMLPESELLPKYTQAQLADGVTLSGTLACDTCKGKLLVRLLPPPPGQEAGGTEADSIQLVTIGVFDGPGEFSLKGPKGQKVVLQVVDDANSDGKPSAGERMGMSADGPLVLEADVADLTLEVGVFPNQPLPTPDGPSPGAASTSGKGAATAPAPAASGGASEPKEAGGAGAAGK